MTIARSTGAFVGTSESSLQAVSAGATHDGSEVDVLGDNTSAGEVEVYAVVTFGTVATVAGVNVKVCKRRATGEAYSPQFYPFVVAAVASTTVKVPLGRVSAERYMSASAQNADGSNGVSVSILYTLFKLS